MRLSKRLKAAALAAVVAGPVAASAQAEDLLHQRYLEIQKQYEKDHPGKQPAKPVQVQPVVLFPNAMRAEPGLAVSAGMAKPIEQFLALANDGNRNDAAIAAGEALIAGGRASRYDLAVVYRALGYAYLDGGGGARSVDCMQKSLGQDALSNNDQYSLMLQVARTQAAMGQADSGLAMLTRLAAETRQDKPEYDGLRGRMYYAKKDYADAAQALQKSIDASENVTPDQRDMLADSYFKLGQFEQAEKAGEEVVHSRPDDRIAIMNLATVYRQAGHADRASALVADARRRGLLTDADGSRASYVLYSDRK